MQRSVRPPPAFAAAAVGATHATLPASLHIPQHGTLSTAPVLHQGRSCHSLPPGLNAGLVAGVAADPPAATLTQRLPISARPLVCQSGSWYCCCQSLLMSLPAPSVSFHTKRRRSVPAGRVAGLVAGVAAGCAGVP